MPDVYEFYNLGIGDPFPISSASMLGLGDMLDEVGKHFPDYAKDEEKTEHEFFCDWINCNVAMARDQFITVKEKFGKTDGIQA